MKPYKNVWEPTHTFQCDKNNGVCLKCFSLDDIKSVCLILYIESLIRIIHIYIQTERICISNSSLFSKTAIINKVTVYLMWSHTIIFSRLFIISFSEIFTEYLILYLWKSFFKYLNGAIFLYVILSLLCVCVRMVLAFSLGSSH